MKWPSDDEKDSPIPPQQVISAYVQGYFPMGDEATGRIHWLCPERRAILPLDGFSISRSWQRALRKNEFEIRCDANFDRVVYECAQPRAEFDGIWITEPMRLTYGRLYELGVGHCVETWLGDRLVGGIYGLAIRGVFFGESMFSRPGDGGSGASKVALWFLVQHLLRRGYALFDAQYLNEHTRRLGFVEITRGEYLTRLARAIAMSDVSWGQFEIA